jgi:hypothetical protein
MRKLLLPTLLPRRLMPPLLRPMPLLLRLPPLMLPLLRLLTLLRSTPLLRPLTLLRPKLRSRNRLDYCFEPSGSMTRPGQYRYRLPGL